MQVDARPSDSIAIALRLQAPIFAQESLLTVVETEDDEETTGSYASPPAVPPAAAAAPDRDELSAEQLKAYLENLRPEDFGKFNL